MFAQIYTCSKVCVPTGTNILHIKIYLNRNRRREKESTSPCINSYRQCSYRLTCFKWYVNLPRFCLNYEHCDDGANDNDIFGNRLSSLKKTHNRNNNKNNHNNECICHLLQTLRFYDWLPLASAIIQTDFIWLEDLHLWCAATANAHPHTHTHTRTYSIETKLYDTPSRNWINETRLRRNRSIVSHRDCVGCFGISRNRYYSIRNCRKWITNGTMIAQILPFIVWLNIEKMRLKFWHKGFALSFTVALRVSTFANRIFIFVSQLQSLVPHTHTHSSLKLASIFWLHGTFIYKKKTCQ